MGEDEKGLDQDDNSLEFDEQTREQEQDVLTGPSPDSVEKIEEAPEDSEISDKQAEAKVSEICSEIIRHFPLQRPARIRMRQDEMTIFVNIEGDGTGLLIGRRGQTLEAIQYIVNRIAYRQVQTRKRIEVDTEHYRARRRGQLVAQARRAAEEVRETGEPVILDPMPASERRVIHLTLKDHPDLYTESEGPHGYRSVIVKPKARNEDDSHL
jgi:spoIIIJ-associated protein